MGRDGESGDTEGGTGKRSRVYEVHRHLPPYVVTHLLPKTLPLPPIFDPKNPVCSSSVLRPGRDTVGCVVQDPRSHLLSHSRYDPTSPHTSRSHHDPTRSPLRASPRGLRCVDVEVPPTTSILYWSFTVDTHPTTRDWLVRSDVGVLPSLRQCECLSRRLRTSPLLD